MLLARFHLATFSRFHVLPSQVPQFPVPRAEMRNSLIYAPQNHETLETLALAGSKTRSRPIRHAARSAPRRVRLGPGGADGLNALELAAGLRTHFAGERRAWLRDLVSDVADRLSGQRRVFWLAVRSHLGE